VGQPRARELLLAALTYAERGIPVFPCRPKGKEPLGRLAPHGLTDATTDTDRIHEWWQAEPSANVGLAVPAGVVVLDVDGPEGRASVEGLPLPPTPMATTARGAHYFFAIPDGLVAKNRAKLRPGLDVRTVGGYVVAPPSIHPTGVVYGWVSGLALGEVDLAPAPEWLLALLRERTEPKPTLTPKPRGRGPSAVLPPYVLAAVDAEVERVANAPEGERNDTLNTAAFALGQFVATGVLPRDDAVRGLEVAARQCGLPDDEAHRTIASGLAAGEREPRDLSGVGTKAQAAKERKRKPPAADGFALQPSPPERPQAKADAAKVLATDLRGAPPDSDMGMARLLVAIADGTLLRTYGRGWFAWDGQRWRAGEDSALRVAARLPEALLAAAVSLHDDPQRREALSKAAWRAHRGAALASAVTLAAPFLRVEDEDLDADPWALTVANGTLDLRIGKLRPHNPADRITRLAPVAFDPAAEAPVWAEFLATVLPNDDTRSFVQRAAGYSASGVCRERVLFVCHGSGRNGKSTLLRALQGVLGDYAGQVTADVFLASRTEDERLTVGLEGRRLVCAAETAEDRTLRENFVKTVTGQDRLVGRLLYHERHEFVPECKLWLATNHRPRIIGTDPAIWDRVRLIPFTVRVPDDAVNTTLGDELAAEGPGVLAWVVEGCRSWLANGLRPAAEVVAAVREYRSSEDVLAEWLAECTESYPGGFVLGSRLYVHYRQWAETRGERIVSSRAFSDALAERGFERKKGTGGGRGWVGLLLRDTSTIATNTVPTETE